MSAKFILHIAGSLDRLADLSPAKRLKAFAPIIGYDVAVSYTGDSRMGRVPS